VKVKIQFYSYFKELAGRNEFLIDLESNATIADLLDAAGREFPALAGMRNSTLVAVGVDYQPRDHRLREGDEVALFPPVQGG
jgi:molybdopterin converting factor small subunit